MFSKSVSIDRFRTSLLVLHEISNSYDMDLRFQQTPKWQKLNVTSVSILVHTSRCRWFPFRMKKIIVINVQNLEEAPGDSASF